MMKPWFATLPLVICTLFLQSCNPNQSEPDLPLSGGIQVSIHTSGGIEGLNDTILISDHWQLSSVGRHHGWVRKLNPVEQRQLVSAMKNFHRLTFNHADPEVNDGIGISVVARGNGEGVGKTADAEKLLTLVDQLVTARRVASR